MAKIYKLRANLPFLHNKYTKLIDKFYYKLMLNPKSNINNNLSTRITQYITDPRTFTYAVSHDGWIEKNEDVNLFTEWVISTDKLNSKKNSASYEQYTFDYKVTKLKNDCEKHIAFCESICRLPPIYKDDFDSMVGEYEDFLNAQINPKKHGIILPTLRQRFLWHAHMLNSKAYIYDMQHIIGYVPVNQMAILSIERDTAKTSEDLDIVDKKIIIMV